MNLQQLEYIIALDQYRHFGHAAEHCSVSQPTLSTMVQKLEDELGAKIFDRSRSGIVPTSVGARLIEQAAAVLHQVSVLREIVADNENTLGGSVTVAILPTIAPYLLPRVNEIIIGELPNLHINFVEMVTEQCMDALRSGQIDMAIIASDESDGVQTTPLYYEEFFGYVARNETLFSHSSIRTSEVNPASLWLLDEGHCFRDQLMRFCQLRRNYDARLSYRRGSLQTFMHMVERGQGMTFIPELSLDVLNAEHRELVRPFALPRPCRMVALSTRVDYARTALAARFSDVLRAAVPSRMHKLQPGQHLV